MSKDNHGIAAFPNGQLIAKAGVLLPGVSRKLSGDGAEEGV